MKAYLALIKLDLKLAMRLRAVVFFNYLFPMIFFFTIGTFMEAKGNPERATVVVTMSVTLGILGNGLFGAGIRALQEREMNILRRYKVTPITPTPLLVASMVTGWIIFLPYILVLLTFSHYWYQMPWPRHMVSLVGFISLGLITFRSIGLVIASVANTMQEGNILVQLLYFPMLFLSGATFPIRGPVFSVVSKFIPARYLVDGMKDIMLKGSGFGWQATGELWQAAGALLVTLVVGLTVGSKLFRWEKDEKIRGSAKLWVLAVLLPFVIIGLWQSFHK